MIFKIIIIIKEVLIIIGNLSYFNKKYSKDRNKEIVYPQINGNIIIGSINNLYNNYPKKENLRENSNSSINEKNSKVKNRGKSLSHFQVSKENQPQKRNSIQMQRQHSNSSIVKKQNSNILDKFTKNAKILKNQSSISNKQLMNTLA